MTQKELIKSISLKTGYKREVVEKIMTAYTAVAFEEFERQGSIKLSNLGVLRYTNSILHNGYNPVSGKHMVFTGRNKIKFIPSKALDMMLNKPKGN